MVEIKLKLSEIKAMAESVNVFLNTDLPFGVSYEFGKIAERLSNELELLEKTRKRVVKKYIDENENEITDKKKEQEFYDEMAEFLNKEVKIKIDKKINVGQDIGRDVKIKPKHLIILKKFFTG